ncbi:MAG: O-antigen polymerase [Capnocytophaga sp.]|nr:O-antigen polymerase [Capnocytophaga sp.]
MIRIIFIIITLLLITLLTGDGYPNYLDKSFIGLILFMNLITLLMFIFRKENNIYFEKQYIRISYLFLIGFIVVHFQMYIDVFLGFLSDDNSFLFINNRVAVKSLLISSIAFSAFCLGYVFNTNREKQKSDIPIHQNKVITPLGTNWAFYLACIFLLVYFMTVNKSYLAGNYGLVERGQLAGKASFIFECLITSILIIKARNIVLLQGFGTELKTIIIYFKKEIILLFIYFATEMMAGERGFIISNSLFLTGIILYVTKIKVGKLRILLFLGIASFILSLLGVVRKLDDDGSFFEKLAIAFNDDTESRYYPNSFLNSTKELASSGRTLNIAVDGIERGTARHTYGLFAIQDLMLLVPTLRSTFISTFDIPLPLTSSPEYLTYLNLGPFPSWGVGSSCVADTYLDFGLLGIVVVYFLFGFLVRKLEIAIFKTKLVNLVVFIIALSVLAYSIYISRSTIIYSLSKFAYILVFVYTILFINKIKATYK